MIRLARGTVAALTILVLAAGWLVPASAQDASSTTGTTSPGGVVQSWALAPAGSADPNQPGNRQELSYQGAPGTTIDDAVTLSNLGNVPLEFNVYATDAFNDPDGGFDLLDGAAAPTDVGTWVALEQNKFTVPPQTELTVPMRITIPPDARPGDHVGAILASSPAPGRAPNGQIIPIDRRTGPRLFIRVAGPLQSELAVQGLSSSYEPALNPLGGSGHVHFHVANRGNVRTSGSYTIKVGGPFGLGGKTVSGDVPELIPGQSMTVDATVDEVPAGVVSTTRVQLTSAPPNGAGDSASVSSSTRTLALPWLLISLVVVLLLLGFVVSRIRRHDRPASGGRGSGTGPGGSGPGAGTPSGPRQLESAGSLSGPVIQGRQ